MNYLKLDDLEIQNEQLTGFVFDWNGDIHFYGMALDYEGKKICDRLSKFKLNSIIEVEAKSDTAIFNGI
jgi:hypothetical protein